MHFRNEDRKDKTLPTTVVEKKLSASGGDGSWFYGSLTKKAGGSKPRLWHLQYPPTSTSLEDA